MYRTNIEIYGQIPKLYIRSWAVRSTSAVFVRYIFLPGGRRGRPPGAKILCTRTVLVDLAAQLLVHNLGIWPYITHRYIHMISLLGFSNICSLHILFPAEHFRDFPDNSEMMKNAGKHRST